MGSSQKTSHRDHRNEDESMEERDLYRPNYTHRRQPQSSSTRPNTSQSQRSGHHPECQSPGPSDSSSIVYTPEGVAFQTDGTRWYHVVQLDDCENPVDMPLLDDGKIYPDTGVITACTFLMYKLNPNDVFKNGMTPEEDEARWIESLCLDKVVEAIYPTEDRKTIDTITRSLTGSATRWRLEDFDRSPFLTPVEPASYSTPRLPEHEDQESVSSSTHRSGISWHKRQDHPEYTDGPNESKEEWALSEDTFQVPYRPRPEDRPKSPEDIYSV